MRLAHARQATAQVLVQDARCHFIGTGCKRGQRGSAHSRRAFVLCRVLLVRRVLRRVVPHVRPGNEHDSGNAMLHVRHVVA